MMERLINSAVVVDPDIMSGMPVFSGTRVPVKVLFDTLASGDSVDSFLEDFNWVEREHVLKVLEWSRTQLEAAAERYETVS